jgi:glycosyltransferase involved in cell wall biosynthesis
MAARDPWLSIVMPVWNGERYLREALESIRQEGTGGYEVIAVDDGSSDRSPEILREWERHLPLRHLARERGGNWVAATNAGLREARGEYVCFLHQDDLWLPGRLAAIRQEARHEPALILHPAVFIAADGSRLGTWRCPLPAGEVEPPLFAERLIVQNFIAIPAPAFRREAALALGGLDEALWYLADWDLWLRLGSQGAIRYLTSALAAFRVHPSSQTMVRKDLADRRWQHEVVLERHAAGARRQVRRAARFSVELNLALLAAASGTTISWRPLLAALTRLGPAGWVRYLRDSRIVERIRARLHLRGSRLNGGAGG